MKNVALGLLVVLGLLIYFVNRDRPPTPVDSSVPPPLPPRHVRPAPADPSADPPTPVTAESPAPVPDGPLTLDEQIARASRVVDAATAEVERAKAAALAADPKWTKARADVDRLKAELEAARAGDDTQAKLDASLAYNTARAGLPAAESAALAASADHRRAVADLDVARKVLMVPMRERNAIAAERASADLARREREAALLKPIEEITVGAVGRLGAYRVVQVVDDLNVIVEMHEGKALVWFEGFPTASMVDGNSYQTHDPVRIAGTKRYATLLGGSRQVPLAIPAK